MSSASLSSAPPNIGDTAPHFELPDPDMKMRKLSEFLGQKTILAFFPAAESPVCTAEMCALRDSLDSLRDLGANVVGISVDGPFANPFFVQRRHRNLPVLSDYGGEVTRQDGIALESLASLGGYHAAKSSVFILDESGKVIYRWISDDPMVEP